MNGDENHGSWLATATGMFFAWALFAVIVRSWAKLRTKTWGLDDYALAAAFLAALVHVILVWRAVKFGFGRPVADIEDHDLDQVELHMYIAHFFYVISIGLCRISSALFVSQIAYSIEHVWPARTMACLSGAWSAASVIALAIRGDLDRPWAVVRDNNGLFKRWLGIEVSGLVTEIGLWALSFHLVWGLQMKYKRKRIFILAAFGTRLLMIPIVIARLIYLSPSKNTSPTITSVTPSIIAEAAIHFSIIAGSATALKPFLTSFHPAYVVENSTTTGTTLNSALQSKDRGRASSALRQQRDDPYYRLEVLAPNGSHSSKSRDPTTDITWRPYHGGRGEGFATAYPSASSGEGSAKSSSKRAAKLEKKAAGRKTGAAEEGDGAERMIIQRTMEVSIQYNDGTK